MYCEKCDITSGEDDKFCEKCGSELKPKPVFTEEVVDDGAEEIEVEEVKSVTNNNKKKGSMKFVGIGIIVIIIAVGVFIAVSKFINTPDKVAENFLKAMDAKHGEEMFNSFPEDVQNAILEENGNKLGQAYNQMEQFKDNSGFDFKGNWLERLRITNLGQDKDSAFLIYGDTAEKDSGFIYLVKESSKWKVMLVE